MTGREQVQSRSSRVKFFFFVFRDIQGLYTRSKSKENINVLSINELDLISRLAPGEDKGARVLILYFVY